VGGLLWWEGEIFLSFRTVLSYSLMGTGEATLLKQERKNPSSSSPRKIFQSLEEKKASILSLRRASRFRNVFWEKISSSKPRFRKKAFVLRKSLSLPV